MEDLSTFIDMPSPSSSLQYMYPDSEQYLDPSASETHSSVNSPVSIYSLVGYFPPGLCLVLTLGSSVRHVINT